MPKLSRLPTFCLNRSIHQYRIALFAYKISPPMEVNGVESSLANNAAKIWPQIIFTIVLIYPRLKIGNSIHGIFGDCPLPESCFLFMKRKRVIVMKFSREISSRPRSSKENFLQRREYIFFSARMSVSTSLAGGGGERKRFLEKIEKRLSSDFPDKSNVSPFSRSDNCTHTIFVNRRRRINRNPSPSKCGGTKGRGK